MPEPDGRENCWIRGQRPVELTHFKVNYKFVDELRDFKQTESEVRKKIRENLARHTAQMAQDLDRELLSAFNAEKR